MKHSDPFWNCPKCRARIKRLLLISAACLVGICLIVMLLFVFAADANNDLDKFPKIKTQLVRVLEKSGVSDACALLSDDKIKLYPEIFKRSVLKCPDCGRWCKLTKTAWTCVCGWSKELPEDTYGLIFTPESIRRGKQFIFENETLLEAVELKYGVPKNIIASITRVETNFGNYLGRLEVVNAILTWIVHGRWYRKAMFERELKAWLTIAQRDSHDPYSKGSICGAFGLVQFMPSSYQRWSVDWDGDGRADLFSVPDAMASCANYLKGNGWGNTEAKQRRAIMAYNADRAYTRSVLNYAKAIRTYKVMRASGE